MSNSDITGTTSVQSPIPKTLICSKCGEMARAAERPTGIKRILDFLCIIVPLVVAGYGPPRNCPSCGGEKTLIDSNSPMGRKILQGTINPMKPEDVESVNVEETQTGISPTVQNTSPTGFCTECGTPRCASDKFCHKCGKAFNHS